MIAMEVLCISSHAKNPKYCCMQSLRGICNSFYIGCMAVRTFNAKFIAFVPAFKDCFTAYHLGIKISRLFRQHLISIIKKILIKFW